MSLHERNDWAHLSFLKHGLRPSAFAAPRNPGANRLQFAALIDLNPQKAAMWRVEKMFTSSM